MNIVEFSKMLNLSTATVSRALNDRPEVSEKTRRMVLAKAQEFGFSRNVNARRLVTGRTNLIQLECPSNTHILSDRYLVELARALEEAAGEHGFDLLLRLGTRRRAIAEIQAVDGLVVVAGSEIDPAEIVDLTSGGQTPAVVIMDASRPEASHVAWVRIDTLSGVSQAFALLAEQGHRRVGYIGSAQPGMITTALPSLMAQAGLSWDPALAIEAGILPEDGARAARKLLSMPTPPTAIFARTDILATAVVQTARQMNVRVPDDLSVIGHDNIEAAALVDPPLTTVAIDIPSVATAAIDSLLALMADREIPPIRTLGTQLVIRESVGPAPGKVER